MSDRTFYETLDVVRERVEEQLTADNYLDSIKLTRELSNGAWGLAEARHAVNNMCRHKGIDVPTQMPLSANRY